MISALTSSTFPNFFISCFTGPGFEFFLFFSFFVQSPPAVHPPHPELSSSGFLMLLGCLITHFQFPHSPAHLKGLVPTFSALITCSHSQVINLYFTEKAEAIRRQFLDAHKPFIFLPTIASCPLLSCSFLHEASCFYRKLVAPLFHKSSSPFAYSRILIFPLCISAHSPYKMIPTSIYTYCYFFHLKLNKIVSDSTFSISYCLCLLIFVQSSLF